MSTRISISDFTFVPSGYGYYKVIYRSPVTLRAWVVTTNNMPLIDATKNSDSPKRKDLEQLRKLCKARRVLWQSVR